MSASASATASASTSTQPRTYQRRQGSASETSSTMDQSQGPSTGGSQTRSASGQSGMGRAHGSRSSNPDKQISQIEKSVTHLLVATKQLLETLTQWSRGNAQEEEVSDVYVRLGYEFNLACRAFNSIGVDTGDLGPVPDLLRSILEDTLSQPASPQALDNYLPRIRDIIINLLQGLKRKQSKLRVRPTKDASANTNTSNRAGQSQSRQGSIASNTTSDATSTAITDLPTVPEQGRGRDSPVAIDDLNTQPDIILNPPPTAGLERRSSLRRSIRRDPGQQIPSSDSNSSMSSVTAQNLPVIAPPQADSDSTVANFPHAPPPPPKQDALTALQRGGDLERRASRRFSAYQISKHLGASPNGVPVIPPAQNSPIPNRGREVRESMRAVTSRTSYQAARQKSANKIDGVSPSRMASQRQMQRVSEETEEPPTLDTQNVPKMDQPQEQDRSDSPLAKTPDEFHAPKSDYVTSPGPQLGATVNGPFSPTKEKLEFGDNDTQDQQVNTLPTIRERSQSPEKTPAQPVAETRPSVTPEPTAQADLESSPASTKDLTLFLQYKTRVKKFMLPGGYENLTLARLQLAFIEKFNWHSHDTGVDLPEIYIQDPISGVRHELEDLSDVKDRSVLVLNFEVLDEVKKHFDEGIGGLSSTLTGIKSLLDGQNGLMQRFADRQLEASKEMARLSAAPTPRATRASTIDMDKITGPITAKTPVTENQLLELQNLRRDIAVLRQTYSAMSADFAASMKDIKSKAANVKAAAESAVQPTYEGNAGRSHVNDGKKTLSSDSEALVNRVDNLSDTVEDLRKDVVSRGVRPRPRDLEALSVEISTTVKDLARVKEFIKREKPIWTKIWEQELNLVCTERDDLTQQEELMSDLFGDLEDVQNVFNLVEEAMKQQNLTGGAGSLRQTGRNIEIDPTVDPNAAKDGVLDEVRALRPNHENRLEAIERAEKQRQRDLAHRRLNEFQKEVEDFVEEGKLKKTGGMDEVERIRELREARARKENWETQQRIEEEKARKRAEREAAKARAKAEAEAQSQAQENGNTVAEQPSEPASQSPDALHEPSQESEASFQDAATGTTPQPTPKMEEYQESPPPLPISKSPPPDHEQEHLNDDNAAPQIPEMQIGGERKSSTGEEPKPERSSWWKPAVF